GLAFTIEIIVFACISTSGTSSTSLILRIVLAYTIKISVFAYGFLTFWILRIVLATIKFLACLSTTTSWILRIVLAYTIKIIVFAYGFITFWILSRISLAYISTSGISSTFWTRVGIRTRTFGACGTFTSRTLAWRNVCTSISS